MSEAPPVRFAAIGLAHLHVFSQIGLLQSANAELVAYHSDGRDLGGGFANLYPQARAVADPREILEDPSIQLVVCAAIPDQRSRIGVEAMRHGKDVFLDKPGATTLEGLEELRKTQQQTGRLCPIFYSERLMSRATEHALELVRDGAIGRVVEAVGFGPHQIGLAPRPDWFYQRARSGGILADLASHQTDQFLLFTSARDAEVALAHVANHRSPEHPDFDDFGELVLRAPGASGFARVDWYTPDGLGTWGDVRLWVLGTDGYLEVRKNVDPAGRSGGDHLILVDGESARHVDCSEVPLLFPGRLVADVLHRTQDALPQEHCFRAMQLALEAQARATRITPAS